jgi:hypothetical protein
MVSSCHSGVRTTPGDDTSPSLVAPAYSRTWNIAVPVLATERTQAA